jgi:hypothetical protein
MTTDTTARANLADAITATADWLRDKWRDEPDIKTISSIVNGYISRLTAIVKAALRSGDAIEMRRAHKQLLKNAAADVYRDGLREGGIEPKDESPEDKAATAEAIDNWLTAQFDFVSQYSKDAASGRKDKTIRDVILARVDQWGISLQNFGEAGRLAALGNIPLTLDGEDGTESCDQCQEYKGQRHRRNWWAERDLLRRNGNENYDCGRWDNCHHYFRNDSGDVIVT